MDLRKALLLNNGEFWAVSVASLFRSFGFGMAWPFFSFVGIIFLAALVMSF